MDPLQECFDESLKLASWPGDSLHPFFASGILLSRRPIALIGGCVPQASPFKKTPHSGRLGGLVAPVVPWLCPGGVYPIPRPHFP